MVSSPDYSTAYAPYPDVYYLGQIHTQPKYVIHKALHTAQDMHQSRWHPKPMAHPVHTF